MKNIVYIEDDETIGSWLKEELEDNGYHVSWYLSDEGSEEGMKNADLVILDVMLPRLDGFTLGQRFKTNYNDVPIIMLTARTALDDKVQGLTFADDYLTKPFHPKELMARMEVLLRRYNRQEEDYRTVGHLDVYTKQQRIIRRSDDEEIILTGKQHQLFFFFTRHFNQTLTKEQIFESIWKDPYIEGDKTLTVHIRHLREKIEEDPSKPKIIETIRGIGYRMKA
ncbi:response regulator transcription factor [Priestia filamentosa]|uniref:response regulator transcription factor n=1 Tax=Priestia filamentosa TaxID=1402861 RepID=UPI003D26B2CD